MKWKTKEWAYLEKVDWEKFIAKIDKPPKPTSMLVAMMKRLAFWRKKD